MNATMFFLFLSTKNEPGPVGGQEPGDWRGRGYAACFEDQACRAIRLLQSSPRSPLLRAGAGV